MTEEQIERRVERMVDTLDRRYLSRNSTMTEAQYKEEMRAIDSWAQQQRSSLSKGTDRA